jgi:hypothetical protein
VRAIVAALGEVLPDLAAAATEDEDDDAFEAALDQAFASPGLSDGEDDDWFGLAASAG